MVDHTYGISFYKAVVGGCIKRHYCEASADTAEVDEGMSHAEFGTAVHEWLAAYHYGEVLPTLSEEVPPKAYVSPAELCRRYAKRFSRGGLGVAEPVEGRKLIEEQLFTEIPFKDGHPPIPFTGILDAPVRFDAEGVERLREERGVSLPGPGTYLIDHKTKSRKPPYLVEQFLNDPQFTGYHRLWEANGGEPLQGTLVNILYRYKDDKAEGFLTLFVGPPDEMADKVWLGLIRDGHERLLSLGEGWMDPTKCYDWGRRCPCLDTCPRSNLAG